MDIVLDRFTTVHHLIGAPWNKEPFGVKPQVECGFNKPPTRFGPELRAPNR